MSVIIKLIHPTSGETIDVCVPESMLLSDLFETNIAYGFLCEGHFAAINKSKKRILDNEKTIGENGIKNKDVIFIVVPTGSHVPRYSCLSIIHPFNGSKLSVYLDGSKYCLKNIFMQLIENGFLPPANYVGVKMYSNLLLNNDEYYDLFPHCYDTVRAVPEDDWVPPSPPSANTVRISVRYAANYYADHYIFVSDEEILGHILTPFTEEDSYQIGYYNAINVRSGQKLDCEKSIRENGIENNDIILIIRYVNIKVIHPTNNSAIDIGVPGEIILRDVFAQLVEANFLAAGTKYFGVNQSKDNKPLDLEKTLGDNGVEDNDVILTYVINLDGE